MKKKNINIMYLIICALAMPVLAEANYYKLEDAFNKAGTVSKEEVVGWMSGRCFPTDNPYRAENSLLVATEVRYHSGGPALGGEHHYMMWWAWNEGATYFDYMSQGEIISTRNSLNWIFSNLRIRKSFGSLMITYSSNLGTKMC